MTTVGLWKLFTIMSFFAGLFIGLGIMSQVLRTTIERHIQELREFNQRLEQKSREVEEITARWAARLRDHGR